MRNARALSIFVVVLVACAREQTPTPPTGTTEIPDTSGTSAAGAMTTTGDQPPGTAKQVDHYEFWTVEPRQLGRDVSLKGQFDEDDRTGTTEAVWRLGNPVQKTVAPKPPEDSVNKEVHLVAYRLAPEPKPPVTWRVEVTNQFSGTPVTWDVRDHPIDPEKYPLLLLLPSRKKSAQFMEPAPVGPQFVCYPIVSKEVVPVRGPVKLVDQFSDQSVSNLIPKYLCVPVKTGYQPMWNDVVHLSLYEYSSQVQPALAAVRTRDRLHDWDALPVGTSVMLGVPSTKKVLKKF